MNQHQAKATRRRCSGPPKIRPPASNLAKETKKESQKKKDKREEGKMKVERKKKRSSRMKANVLAKRKVGFNGCGLGGD